MSTRLLVPPTMSELMEDSIYVKFIKRNVTLPLNVQHGNPWMIMARRAPEIDKPTWARKLMPTYRDAYFKMKELLDNPEFTDVSVISRRVLFAPPAGFRWSRGRYQWCGRCRRPTLFQYAIKHPALVGAIVLSTEDSYRCVYCGVKQSFMPRYAFTIEN
jgi:hypothetical protein